MNCTPKVFCLTFGVEFIITQPSGYSLLRLAATRSVVESKTFFGGITVMDFPLDILLGCNQGRFREFLVIAGNLNLLAVFGNFLEVIVEGSEFLELLVEFVFHLAGNLIGALCDNGNGLVDISGVLAKVHHVAGDGVERSVGLLVVHIILWCFLFRSEISG